VCTHLYSQLTRCAFVVFFFTQRTYQTIVLYTIFDFITFMKSTLRLIQALYSIYAILVFVVLMLLALPFIFLSLSLGIIRGGNLIYRWCKLWIRIWYQFIGLQHQAIFDGHYDVRQQYIFVANHISYMDIPPALLAVKQPCRVLGKAEMAKYPIFGWIYKTAVIMVDRSSAAGRAKSVRALKAALARGISIFIFPEGTFNEGSAPLKAFYDGAFRIAIETQTPIKPMLFIDTIDRLHYSSILKATPGKNRVVYLETVPVTGLTLADVAQLKESVYQLMDAGLRRYRNYPG